MLSYSMVHIVFQTIIILHAYVSPLVYISTNILAESMSVMDDANKSINHTQALC